MNAIEIFVPDAGMIKGKTGTHKTSDELTVEVKVVPCSSSIRIHLDKAPRAIRRKIPTGMFNPHGDVAYITERRPAKSFASMVTTGSNGMDSMYIRGIGKERFI